MRLEQAEWLAAFITNFQLKRILEIGTYHGVSACYLGVSVQPLGGTVVTVDIPSSQKLSPNAEQALERCGLGNVTLQRHRAGAEWLMMGMIERGEVFDFIYIDGGHTWAVTGMQFFLAERLLRPGSWLLFDDIRYYTVAKDPTSSDSAWAKQLTEEERTTCQVGKVWELLVRPHKGFCNFIEHGNWGLCQKRPHGGYSE